ncbi:MAG TPA: cytochrome c peroxidase [Thermoanaerobaculia bacterium]|nr:cytochrome c peroxidase [Thermoanaerobaculia bacterium]
MRRLISSPISGAFTVVLFLTAVTTGVARDTSKPAAGGLTPATLDRLSRLPGGLAALPSAFPLTPAHAAKVSLGRELFFDKRLSGDRSMSCATCHDPRFAFADGKPLSAGFLGKTLRRHSPTVLNAALTVPQFWDGRAAGLEEQATMPIMSKDEMNMADETMLVSRLEDDDAYRRAFRAVYGAAPNLKLIADALVAFEQTLVTPDAPFDRYVRGDRGALTAQEKRGLALFVGKAACSQCHLGPGFTDGSFHNLGIPVAPGHPADDGRFEVTKDAKDRGAFKTPTLRNVDRTAPYLHDGSMTTLEEVVDLYNRGGGPGAGKSDLLFELGLTPREKTDLVAFLHSLPGTMPALPERR